MKAGPVRRNIATGTNIVSMKFSLFTPHLNNVNSNHCQTRVKLAT